MKGHDEMTPLIMEASDQSVGAPVKTWGSTLMDDLKRKEE